MFEQFLETAELELIVGVFETAEYEFGLSTNERELLTKIRDNLDAQTHVGEGI
jgi:hypothetical protein